MGKRPIVRKRGRGAGKTTANSSKFKTTAKYTTSLETDKGVVTGFLDDPARTSVSMTVQWTSGKKEYYIAPEGIAVNDEISSHGNSVSLGNIMFLKDVPEGIPIFNIEQKPGDGGKSVRSSGTSAYIVAKRKGKAIIKLPSKHMKDYNEKCRATIGVVAGGGRTDKPLMKAGNSFHKKRARGQLWPIVRGVAMNAYSHPFGGSQHHSGKPTTTSRTAPPGRKVGHIAAKRTGRKKR